jgi:uncharacterized protein YkwD
MRTTAGLVFVLALASVASAQQAATTQVATQQQAAQQVRPLHQHPTLLSMLARNNQIRARAGLFGHRMSPALCAAAQDHANYMARSGQFSHYTNGGPQMRAARYGFRGGVLENIAMNGNSIDHAFGQWSGSGAHYASIVSRTTDAGFGYAVGPNGMAYFVGVYGTGPTGYGSTQQAGQQTYVSSSAQKPAGDAAATANSQPMDGI